MKKTMTLAFALLLALGHAALAQVPHVIHFQGLLPEAMDPEISGWAQFKFALVNAEGNESYWSHDLTSVEGRRPDSGIGLWVTNRFFSVDLGNEEHPRMEPLPPDVFTHPDVHLRVWVRNVGDPNYEQIEEDTPIYSNGYAMMAANILDGVITGAKIAPGAIQAVHLEEESIHAAQLTEGSVTTAKLAEDAVTGDKILDGTIGSKDIKDYLKLRRLDLNPNDDFTSWLGIFNDAGQEAVRSFARDREEGYLSVQNNAGNRRAYLWGRNDSDTDGGQIGLVQKDGMETVTLRASTQVDDSARMVLKQSDGSRSIVLDAEEPDHGNGMPGGPRVTLGQGHGQNGAILHGNTEFGGGGLTLHSQGGTATFRAYGRSPGGALEILNQNGRPNVKIRSRNPGKGVLEMFNESGDQVVSLAGESNGGYVSVSTPENGGAAAIMADEDGGHITLENSEGGQRLYLHGGPAGRLAIKNGEGKSSVSVYSRRNEEGRVEVHDVDGLVTGYLWGRNTDGANGGKLALFNTNNVETIRLLGATGLDDSARIVLRNSDNQRTIILDADEEGEGRITTQVLEITGGADLSEQFDITAGKSELQPGMIVCIDPTNPGSLVPSTRAYDTTVAGIVSGAGGVQPGMLMGQRGSAADGEHPVALTGRVYCWVDADQGAIQPGDLITTSDTLGHGMKAADPAQAQGAIIGKAMSALPAGQGLVLVLVSLQ